MKTIEKYETTKTIILQKLLKEYEDLLENTDINIEMCKMKNENCSDLEKISKNYEIDIHLIRMELTKRLWLSK